MLPREREVEIMYYVLTDAGIDREFDILDEALAYCDRLNENGVDAWVSEDDDEPYDIDSDFGYDPYMGEYTYDC